MAQYTLGQQGLTPAFAAALDRGRVSEPEMAALLQASWELVTRDKGSNDAILFLLGVIQGSYEALNEVMMRISQQNPQMYQQLQAQPAIAGADERFAPLTFDPPGVYAFLLSMSGGFAKTWGELERDRGPLVVGEGDCQMTFAGSPADAISRYVALPLLYGIWPPDFTDKMCQFSGQPGVPDAVLPLQIFNSRGGDDKDEAKQFMAATLRHMADAMANPGRYPGFESIRKSEPPRLGSNGNGQGEQGDQAEQKPPNEGFLTNIWNEFHRVATDAYNYVASATTAAKNRKAIWWGLGLGLGLGVIGYVLVTRRD